MNNVDQKPLEETKSTVSSPNRVRRLYWSIFAVCVVITVMSGAMVSVRLLQASQLEQVAKDADCRVQWGWRHHDSVLDSPTTRRIFGNSQIGFHEDGRTGKPRTTEDWLRVSERLSPWRNRIHGLDFSQSDIDDRAMDDIVSYPRLITICLDNTSVTDFGVIQLAELDDLEYVLVNTSQLSSSSVETLETLEHLRHIYVSGQTELSPPVRDVLTKVVSEREIELTISTP